MKKKNKPITTPAQVKAASKDRSKWGKRLPAGNRLYLHVDKNGGSCRWEVRIQGRREGKPWSRDFGLGSADMVSIKLAHEKRDQLLDQIARGLDPIAERKRAEEAERQAKEAEANRKTFRQVAEAAFAVVKVGWKATSGKTTEVEWLRTIARCERFADKMVDAVTTDDVEAALMPLWAAGHIEAASRMREKIGWIFNYAIEKDWRAAKNPASKATFKILSPKRPPGETKHASLPVADTPDLIARLRVGPWEGMASTAAACIELIVLTASRRDEARGARWSEVDLDKKVWRRPAARMKTTKDHIVPLSDQAVALLRRMQRACSNEWIFPGKGADCISAETLRATLQRLAPVTMHGFRGTFTGWSDANHLSETVREFCLAHEVRGIKKNYSWDDYEVRRPMMQAWADFVAPVANIIPFQRRA